MLSPELGRVAFRMATFLVVVSLGLLLVVNPGSAEQVVTVVALIVGVLLGAMVVFLVRK